MLAFKLPAVSIRLLLINEKYKILIAELLNTIIENYTVQAGNEMISWKILHEHFRKEQIQNLCIGQVFRKLKPIQL